MENQFTPREQIIETVSKLFLYTDNQEWRKLQDEVFTSEIEFDMTSLGAEKIEHVQAREICYRWEKAFEELDAVHHQAGTYVVDIVGNEAQVSAYSIASHYRAAAKKGQTREYVGRYDLHLVRNQGRWRIDRFRYNLRYSTGNLTLE
jgi:hypothetical protein